jgi:phosphatidylserine/phosphatidylglycerophosphate/cardiolipin synthase-like enzyme
MNPPCTKHDTTLVQPWLQDLKAGYSKNITSHPNSFLHNPSASLITTSTLHSLTLGTGASIYASLLPLLESANDKVILVTCFWAASASQNLLNKALKSLSAKAISKGGNKIRVRLCFSSSSILQKLLHPQTTRGKIHPPDSWKSVFHLPEPSELKGLDLVVKSIFLLPFSVMHPKFIIVDSKVAVLPSCNVSWEDWFEGAVTLTGPVVSCFVDFWREFWSQAEDTDDFVSLDTDSTLPLTVVEQQQQQQQQQQERYPGQLPLHTPLESKNIPTVFLPSPHNRNPQFRFPWQECALPPPTPLNTFILRCLGSAQKDIYIQTPNLTAPPVLSAILATLKRGVNVHVITSERLMILEQLVTAGTTTGRCVNTLVKRYHRLRLLHSSSVEQEDLEAGVRLAPGVLRIDFFTPTQARQGGGQGVGEMDAEPQQSHIKCLIVDGDLVVLGSGNLDRASWFTSQELGVAFLDAAFARKLRGDLQETLRGRVKSVL